MATTVLAGAAWAGAVVDALRVMPFETSGHLAGIAVGIAVCATARLMLWTHQRPMALVYEMGYESGRRDQMKQVNAAPTQPIRRVPGGFSEFNRVHSKRLSSKLDA